MCNKATWMYCGFWHQFPVSWISKHVFKCKAEYNSITVEVPKESLRFQRIKRSMFQGWEEAGAIWTEPWRVVGVQQGGVGGIQGSKSLWRKAEGKYKTHGKNHECPGVTETGNMEKCGIMQIWAGARHSLEKDCGWDSKGSGDHM